MRSGFRKLLSPARRSQGGFSLIELVLTVMVLSIFSILGIGQLSDTLSESRYQATLTEMLQIRNALIGDTQVKAAGVRTSFGYLGDVGDVPTSAQGLGALLTNPGIPAYALNTTARIGVGWNGPYLNASDTGADFTKDAWGNNYVYSGITSDPTITSYGADGVAGGTGFNTDITVATRAQNYKSTVHGFIVNGGAIWSGAAEVEISYPNGSGVLTTATDSVVAGDNGYFSFTNIPVGVRSVTIYVGSKASPTQTLGPILVPVERVHYVIPTAYTDRTNTASAITLGSLEWTVQPDSTRTTGQNFSVGTITLKDTTGATCTSCTDPVTFSIDASNNPGSTTLQGTVTVTPVAGVVNVTSANINVAAVGYKLKATSGSIVSALSDSITVTAAAPTLASVTITNTTTHTNLVSYSESFDNAAWFKEAVSVSSNTTDTTDPSGTTNNAEKLTEQAFTSSHHIGRGLSGLVVGASYTASVYVKAGTRYRFQLQVDPVRTVYNLSTGTLTNADGTTVGAIESAGNGWYRISASFIATSSNPTFRIMMLDDSTNYNHSYAGDTSKTLYIYGAQVEAGITHRSYILTTNAAASSSTTLTTRTANLSYGAITGSYTDYCILENNTNSASCSWVAGTLPATYTVGNTVNTKTLSFWVKNAAGTSARVDSNAVAFQPTFILDGLIPAGTPSLAYSLRRLSSTSTNSVRIRRSSDNATQDIGFTAAGDFDTTAFNTFVGASTAFVTTWYDQRGTGRDATQTTTSLQPTLTVVSGVPQMNFTGTQFLNSNVATKTVTNNGADGSVFMVMKVNNANQTNFGTITAVRWSVHANWSDGNLYFDAGDCCGGRTWINNSANAGLSGPAQYSLIRAGTTGIIRWGGIQRATATLTQTFTGTTETFGIGGGIGLAGTTNGNIREFFIVPAGVTGSFTQFRIETSQRRYFWTP